MIEKFALSVSALTYEDKNSISWGAVKYSRKELTVNEFAELVKQGHCFCHCFTTANKDFTIKEKRDENFASARMVFIDIDDAEMPMGEFLARLRRKPTVAYTTPNNHTAKSGWLYRYRLCYLMEEAMTTVADYGGTYDSIMQSIRNDIPSLGMKDNCGRKASQQFGGNARTDCEVAVSGNTYSFSDFPLQNNNASLLFLYKSQTEKPRYEKESVTVTDTDFINDLNKMTSKDLLEKYGSRYPHYDHTELHFENGYALMPQDYQEIYRSWYTDFFEKLDGEKIRVSAVKKHRDGGGRRKKLFIAGLVMKQIMPSVTYEHLLCNLVYERTHYYDNSDKVLTNEVLKAIARNVMRTPVEEIRLKKGTDKKFVVDKRYCAEHGISPNAMKNKVKKMLNDEEIGNVYDCTKSVKENLAMMREMGVKVGKTKLYEWCRENGISTKGEKAEAEKQCLRTGQKEEETQSIRNTTASELREAYLSYFTASSVADKKKCAETIRILKKKIA